MPSTLIENELFNIINILLELNINNKYYSDNELSFLITQHIQNEKRHWNQKYRPYFKKQ